MDLREELLRRRKDNRFIFGGLTLLLVVCSLVYYMLQRGKGLPEQMAANKLLLFVLWYINVILILIIVLVLVRSLFRLLLERRHRILGSKFKTKLVLTAIGLSLIPVLIIFPTMRRIVRIGCCCVILDSRSIYLNISTCRSNSPRIFAILSISIRYYFRLRLFQQAARRVAGTCRKLATFNLIVALNAGNLSNCVPECFRSAGPDGA